MYSALLARYQDVNHLLTSSSFRLVRPVVLAGLATSMLFLAIDRSQPVTIVSACMGIMLLGAVLTRQLNQILELELEVATRARQLTVVSEVVAALNSSTNVGTTLGMALDRLVSALDADAGAIWLPAPGEGENELILVEQQGLPIADRTAELLEDVQSAGQATSDRLIRHTARVTGRPADRAPAECLTVHMGHAGEDFGLVTIMKWNGIFSDTDAAILAAVGSDIGGSLRSVRLISEARKLADKDPVTGLYNHRSAYQRLHQELDKQARDGRPLAVIMMDLDNFKLFNDTYGHPAGDEVLRRVAQILKRSCRDSDTVARYGGDEFIVILPEATLKAALRCAERIQNALLKERFKFQDSNSLPIGFSYGISAFPDDSQEALELVSIADNHLYQSKAQGGNKITSGGGAKAEDTLNTVSGYDLFYAMVVAIDNKDGYTRKHSEDVTEYSVQIARAMGLDEEALKTIQVAGILHDVGKIGVPDAILRKPGHLTDEEFEVMRQHPSFGSFIVGAIPGMERVVEGVRFHHERFDGRGYPEGLAGDRIPLIGRIMAVADAFSAMTTSRPYRKALSEKQALREIRRGLGTQFDPEIGELFVQLRESNLKPVRGGAGENGKSSGAALVPAGAAAEA